MKQQDQGRYRTFTRRALLLGGVQGTLISALAARMYYLQVIEAERYTVLAEENRINLRLLPPPRGRVLDRYGLPIALNDHNYRVVVVAEQTPSLDDTLSLLGQLVPITEADRARVWKERRRNRAFVPITVKENLNWEQVARIEVNAPDLPGVSIEVGQSRDYPYGGTVSHVLGYVAAVSERELTGDPLLELPGFRIGKSGIERQYDELLRGSAGNSQVEVNAVGRIIRELARDEGQPGLDLHTTIDIGLQQFVQQRLTSELSASAVVIDVSSGEILAMGSTPTYDPSAFGRGLTSSEWQALVNDPLHPLTNKAIAGQYPPGSTFKMIVALAALEAGIDPGYSVFCPGHMSLGSARFHCWKRGGHGRLSMVDGIKHSCDVYFYDIARKIGIDTIAVMARRLGLGHVDGIDLPGEKPGLIPDSNWKKATLGESWYPGETLVAGIGQGFITATPLQLATMMARLANGGHEVVPHVLRKGPADPVEDWPILPAAANLDSIEPAAGPVVGLAHSPFPSLGLSEAHLKIVLEGMNRVSNEQGGTAYRARIDIPGMELGGKTGSAQVRRITMAERLTGVKKNDELPWNQRDHALFVAFAPVAAPRYAVSVVVEHGGGGAAVAAPIARDILIEAQTRARDRVLARQIAMATESDPPAMSPAR
jgi:penicillin-binding protein 2